MNDMLYVKMKIWNDIVSTLKYDKTKLECNDGIVNHVEAAFLWELFFFCSDFLSNEPWCVELCRLCTEQICSSRIIQTSDGFHCPLSGVLRSSWMTGCLVGTCGPGLHQCFTTFLTSHPCECTFNTRILKCWVVVKCKGPLSSNLATHPY